MIGVNKHKWLFKRREIVGFLKEDNFMKGKVTLIGCPKLDSVDYGEKFIPWQTITISIGGKILDD